MKSFQTIDVAQAQLKLANESAVLADIRDAASYSQSHAAGAYHLTDATLGNLISDVDPDTPIIVVCYHGISSQGAAQYLIGQGFEEVYSLSGGYEAWQREVKS
jgi:thiosulfate sulfurtransferase